MIINSSSCFSAFHQEMHTTRDLAAISFFGCSMVAFYANGNHAGAIIASDGFSQALKNTMRRVDHFRIKCLMLGMGIGCALVTDRLMTDHGYPSLHLTSMGIGSATKVLDREMNLYLSGKTKDAQGNKVKIKRSEAVIISVITGLAILLFLINQSGTHPILADATLQAFSTAIKNETKKYPPLYVWSIHGATIMTAVLIDLARSQSLMTKQGMTGLALGFFCKEVIRSLIKLQTNDCEEEEEDDGFSPPLPQEKNRTDTVIMEEGTLANSLPDQIQLEAASDHSLAPLKVKKKKKNGKISPTPLQSISLYNPLPIPHQILLTVGVLLMALLAQEKPTYIHPVLQSGITKGGIKFFNQLMRQCSFSQSLPIVTGASGICFMLGYLVNLMKNDPALVQGLFSIAVGLPSGELKTWQLEGKIKRSSF